MKKTLCMILVFILAFTLSLGTALAESGTQPGEETVQTGEQTTQPDDETVQPDEQATQPDDGTVQPAEQEPEPEVQIEKPAKQVIKSLLPGSKKLTVQWKKSPYKDAQYEIQVARNSSFTTSLKTIKKKYPETDVTVTGLTNGKTYYVRVRTFRVANGKKVCGAWSKKKSVKVRSTAIYKNTTVKGIPELRVMRYSDDGDLLVLVNKYYGVSSKYKPSNLVSVSKTYTTYSGAKLKKQAYTAFKKMRSAAKKEGLNFKICSAYRTYATQKALFNQYKRSRGLKVAYTLSAYPGRSEHHTGLAIDLLTGRNGWALDASFANTKEGKWLKKNCAKYGFIIRYPKGKTGITGYAYEPWHFRYVGVKAAKKIMSKGITLEEYLGKLPPGYKKG